MWGISGRAADTGLVAILACLTASLILFATPALAASSNTYQSQFNGEHTNKKSFWPYALATDPAGDVFVADIEHGLVDVFNASGSELVTEITGAETKSEKTNGEAISVFGVAVDASDDVYVADLEHHVVYEFEPTGSGNAYKLIREIEGTATKAESFEPYSLAIGPHEELFVGDLGHGVVDEFDASGSEVLGEVTVSAPLGIAVNASGDVYVAAGSAGVVDEFEPTGTGHEYDLKSEISGTPRGSFEPERVALAANGDLYVSDSVHSVVDRFSSSGSYECQINGKASEPEQCGGEASATPQGSLEPAGLAVGPTGTLYIGGAPHELVDLFSPASEASASGQWTTGEATNLTTTAATLNGTVNPEGGAVTACEFEYGTTIAYGYSALCKQSEVEIGSGISAFPVSAELTDLEVGTKYYFRVAGMGVKGAGQGDQESFTTHAKPASAKIAPPTQITAHSATFNGEVDPEGSASTYHFEYSTDGVSWTVLESKAISGGSGDLPVTQTVSGLSGSTTYRVRLVAVNSEGAEAQSGEETFPTPAASPQISGTGATIINGTEATLFATIDPEKQATTYRFEYGATTAYGIAVPVGEGNAGNTPTQASETLTGLAPFTMYHFRVVAINSTGPIYGPDRTFTTPLATIEEGVPVAAGSCPNEALRAESNTNPLTGAPYSIQLPDCRAYEQVTPSFKSADAVGVGTPSVFEAGVPRDGIGQGGNSMLFESLEIDGSPGSDGEETPTRYELSRGQTEWSTRSLTPPASVFPAAKEELVSAGKTLAGIWAAATPSQSDDAEDLYSQDASGAFSDIGPIAPPSTTEGPPRGAQNISYGGPRGTARTVGASSDLGDVIFQLESKQDESAQSFLWPNDGTGEGGRPSLYEYVGTGHTNGAPALAGVDNAGTQISQCGTELGAPTTESEPPIVRNGISADGTTVFFTAAAGGCLAGAKGPAANELYARIGVPGAAQTTVNVAGSSNCAVSVSCNVTSPVTYQGASADGSKIFFTASQSDLAPGGTDTSNSLYMCELPGDGGATPTAAGVVNACPHIQAISVTGTSSGANVQSVVAVSDEGSRVYFTATGALTSEPDRSLPIGHQVAEEGKDNLYLWEADGNRVIFVATLPSASPSEDQATPDGRYLVFTTTVDLTSDDTSSAAQAFRYDAQTGELMRISISQNGFNSDGNTSNAPASLASSSTERRTISDNGTYVVFQSNDALTPEVQGGQHNVYEWHNGEVYLISDGTDTASRAGLIGMDASGENIFFTTEGRLVGQDTDQDVDIYDARVDGGFPKPSPAPSCSGESCQGLLTVPLTAIVPASTSAPALGNLAPPKKRAPKPQPPTKAQKLSKALEGCHRDSSKDRRIRCEHKARVKYGKSKKQQRKP